MIEPEHANPLVAALLRAIQGYHVHRARETEVRLGRDEEALREWQAQLKERLMDVKARARAYEHYYVLSSSERQELGRRGHDLAKQRYGLYVLSALVITVASYPASLSAATILGTPISMLGDLKVVWPLWIWFTLLVVVAEFLLVESLARLLYHADVRANLESGQGLDESERRQGKRMDIRDPDQQGKERFGLFSIIALATLLVLVDFACNLLFLLNESEAGFGLSLTLAFAGFLSFMGIAVLLARTKHKESWIDSALRRRRPSRGENANPFGLV